MVTASTSASVRGLTTVPLHPLFAAAYPVLFLFGQNMADQVTLAPLWAPLAGALVAAILLIVIGRLISGDWKRGALLATLTLILFFSFGHVWNLVGELLGVRRWLVLIYALIGLLGIVVVMMGRRARWTTDTTRFLNVVGALAVAFNAVPLIGFATGAPATTLPSDAAEVALELDTDAVATLPDLYYIVLDRYPNAETLRDVYDFDNRPFLDELEERGFAIAEDSWAGYWKTAFSLTSTLRMEHLDGDALKDRDPPTFSPIHHALQAHLAVPATLKSLGYEYVHIGNWWEPSSTNVDADRVLLWSDYSEFTSALLSTTAWSLLTPRTTNDADAETTDDATLARSHTLFAFDVLEEAAGRPGATYVFAHLLVPHPPYVFDVDGSQPTPDEMTGRTEDEQMLRQLEWVNDRVLEVIDHLLEASDGEGPVIVLQADEGPWPDRFWDDQREFPWLEATPAEIQQKFGILNAMRLPGGEDPVDHGMSAQSTPVNTFRIVFNAVFEADLPLLEDTTYLSPNYARMYDFIPYDRERQSARP